MCFTIIVTISSLVIVPIKTDKTALFGVIFDSAKCFRGKRTQPAIICSKLTIKALEQGMKYVQS